MALGLAAALLLTALPTCFQHPAATAFETSGAIYGAGANPTGSPIGGGPGYAHYYSPSGARVATNQQELTDALAAAAAGDVVWVPDGTTITIAGRYGRTVKSGVVLASNRGQDGAAGGKIEWACTSSSGMDALLALESGSTISGLTLEGPIATASMSGGKGAACIGLRGVDGASGIEIENCEVSKFAWAGMDFNEGKLDESTRHHIHHCYIHNCQRHGLGYGIAQEGSCAYLAEGCIFRENRHHIMAQAGSAIPNSYEVRYNEFHEAIYASNGNVNGTWYYSHQVDCHGCDSSHSCYAGNVLYIHHNTFYDNPGKPNVCIRGIPMTGCEVSWNWTTKKGTDAGQNADSAVWSQWVSGSAYQRMSVRHNWYGDNAPPAAGSSSDGSPATPDVPLAPTGAAGGLTARPYMYRACATAPGGDGVSYTFNWSDGTTTTTGLMASGATAYACHEWPEPGSYPVYVRVTGIQGAQSGWSFPLMVTITSPLQPSTGSGSAPETPSAPVGACAVEVSTAQAYSAISGDADGDQLEYVFDWGDGTTASLALVPPGAAATMEHAWGQPGTYTVTVTAVGPEGLVSGPSPGLPVTVAAPEQPAPAPATVDPPAQEPAPAPPQVTPPQALDDTPGPPPEAATPGEGAPGQPSGPGPGPSWPTVCAFAAAGAAIVVAGARALRGRGRRPPA